MRTKNPKPTFVMREVNDLVQLAPRHAMKRIHDYEVLGGFGSKNIPPLVRNALSDIATYYSKEVPHES